jgi:hypothetical protein
MERHRLRTLERAIDALEASAASRALSKMADPLADRSLGDLKDLTRLAKEYPMADDDQLRSLLAQEPFMKVVRETMENFAASPTKLDFKTAVGVAAKKDPTAYRKYLAATGQRS